VVVVAGLIVFGAVFALNSAVHSYLILAYTDSDKVAMSVGFYYMANAAGRLAGTVLSGALYQWGLQSGPSDGLIACLWASSAFVLVAGLLSLLLPRHPARGRSRSSSATWGTNARATPQVAPAAARHPQPLTSGIDPGCRLLCPLPRRRG
jgi:hypothetical protein